MPDFLFEIPHVQDSVSEGSTTSIQLGALAGRLSVELRTVVYAPDGRPENVAEHSNMLSIIAPTLAEDCFPELGLDSNLVARYCPTHDGVEAYVGDTPTHEIDEEGYKVKALLEESGIHQLVREYSHRPSFIRVIQEYEEQIIPETRFVRMVDKLLPLIAHLNENCAGLIKDGFTADGIRQNSAEKAALLRADYPDMECVIALREELAELVAQRLELLAEI